MIEPRLSCAMSHSTLPVSTIALILTGLVPGNGRTAMPVSFSNGSKYALTWASCMVPP